MKPAYLDHIGIAVRPQSRLGEALAVLGFPEVGKERIERESVDTSWIRLPVAAAHVELLSPTEPSAQIQNFLDKAGRDVIHHLSFRVENIRSISAALEGKGFQLVYPEPRPGAQGCLVNFLHPKSTGGVLLEITEKAEG